MSSPQSESLADTRYEIEVGLQRIADAPAIVSLHQSLRETALKYKANGGKSADIMSRVRLKLAAEPRKRLILIERLWSLDPGNLDWILRLISAVSELEQSGVPGDFNALRKWLHSVFRAGNAE